MGFLLVELLQAILLLFELSVLHPYQTQEYSTAAHLDC